MTDAAWMNIPNIIQAIGVLIGIYYSATAARKATQASNNTTEVAKETKEQTVKIDAAAEAARIAAQQIATVDKKTDAQTVKIDEGREAAKQAEHNTNHSLDEMRKRYDDLFAAYQQNWEAQQKQWNEHRDQLMAEIAKRDLAKPAVIVTHPGQTSIQSSPGVVGGRRASDTSPEPKSSS